MSYIPKTFSLVNRQWKVKWVSKKKMRKLSRDKHPPLGMCDGRKARIYLNREAHDGLPEEWLMHTFLHELEHAMRFANGEQKHNEKDVDRRAAILHQFLTTMEGDLEGSEVQVRDP